MKLECPCCGLVRDNEAAADNGRTVRGLVCNNRKCKGYRNWIRLPSCTYEGCTAARVADGFCDEHWTTYDAGFGA